MQQNNGIDKKQMISFTVLCLVLFSFMFYFQNKQTKEAELKAPGAENGTGKKMP